jgi:predicted transcriptional regulator
MADSEAIAGNELTAEASEDGSANGASGLDELDELGPGAQQFVEGMGLYFERLGVPRIGGRILGLLMLAERPLTLDDMARALKVSRASVSTNARMSVAVGMVEHVSLRGDRRDYYAFSPDAWTRRIEVVLPLLDLLRRLAEQGLPALDPENTTGRDRLLMAIEFCDFYRHETEASVARWKEHVAGRTGAPRRPPGGAVRQ